MIATVEPIFSKSSPMPFSTSCRICRVCLLYGRFGEKRTLSRQRAIAIYECMA